MILWFIMVKKKKASVLDYITHIIKIARKVRALLISYRYKGKTGVKRVEFIGTEIKRTIMFLKAIEN